MSTRCCYLLVSRTWSEHAHEEPEEERIAKSHATKVVEQSLRCRNIVKRQETAVMRNEIKKRLDGDGRRRGVGWPVSRLLTATDQLDERHGDWGDRFDGRDRRPHASNASRRTGDGAARETNSAI